ncbi:hypothetical protein ANN_17340 [Periplaneta americana]|uniref:Uncharacterized protein n=1 Tax=Periplaneta americana TaxID=6978 RepID=A0ABQ8SUS7_PERAM|nr:hypothetical protein ANN_17340 [Periplaneta americana]
MYRMHLLRIWNYVIRRVRVCKRCGFCLRLGWNACVFSEFHIFHDGNVEPGVYFDGCKVRSGLKFYPHEWREFQRRGIDVLKDDEYKDVLCRGIERRYMFRFRGSERLRKEDIRSQTHLKDAAEKPDKLKKEWSGHVMRRNENRWTRILTIWDPRIGKRNAGRQKPRWADELRSRFDHL